MHGKPLGSSRRVGPLGSCPHAQGLCLTHPTSLPQPRPLTVWQLPIVSDTTSRWHTLGSQQSGVPSHPNESRATHCRGMAGKSARHQLQQQMCCAVAA